MGQRGGRAGHAEQGEPAGIECQDRTLEAVERGMGKGCHQTRASGDRQVAPVAKCRRRDADQKIADGAAGDPHDHGEHDRAEHVEPHAHPGHAAAEAEHERAREVEDEQQRRIESAKQGRSGHR